MKNIKDIQERIDDYKRDTDTYVYGKIIGHQPRRPGQRYSKTLFERKRLGLNAKHLVEWFRTIRPDAKVTIQEWGATKERNLDSGVAWTRGTYNGYRVQIECDGDKLDHRTAETYRYNHQILDWMLRHV